MTSLLFLVVGIVIGLLLAIWCLVNGEVGGALFVYFIIAVFCFVGVNDRSGPPTWI